MKRQNRISGPGMAYRDFLKSKLKERRIRYRALAENLGVAEITVKRWMTTHDLSLENMIRICAVLGISPTVLLDQELTGEARDNTYSESQERHFAENPADFWIFIRSLYRIPYADTLRRSGLGEHRFRTSLRRMEKLGILRLDTGDRIRVLLKGPFLPRPGGDLNRALVPRFRDAILRHFREALPIMNQPGESDISMNRPFEMYLDDETALQFGLELAGVVRKYRALSHARYGARASLRPIAGIVALDRMDAWGKACL